MIINIGALSHIGIASAIAAGVGLILLIGDVMATDKKKQGTNYSESKLLKGTPMTDQPDEKNPKGKPKADQDRTQSQAASDERDALARKTGFNGKMKFDGRFDHSAEQRRLSAHTFTNKQSPDSEESKSSKTDEPPGMEDVPAGASEFYRNNYAKKILEFHARTLYASGDRLVESLTEAKAIAADYATRARQPD